jgi:hypothetical protein
MSWFGRGWRALARQVRRSAREATMFHLVIDAPELGPAGGRGEAAVGRLARRVAELRDRGLVRVETLSMAAARLAAVPSAAPQQSILRRAA